MTAAHAKAAPKATGARHHPAVMTAVVSLRIAAIMVPGVLCSASILRARTNLYRWGTSVSHKPLADRLISFSGTTGGTRSLTYEPSGSDSGKRCPSLSRLVAR